MIRRALLKTLADKLTWAPKMPNASLRQRPTLIYFVRHATTPTTGKVLPGRAGGLHLSDEGLAQAKATARRLAEAGPIAAVYSSPLERALETAEQIAHLAGLEVAVEPGLLECDFGEWTGQPLAKLRKTKEWAKLTSWPSGFCFPGGESLRALQQRVHATVAKLQAAHPAQAVVAVTHADPIRAVAADVLGLHLDGFHRIHVEPASVTAIAFGQLGARMLSLNNCEHLPTLKHGRRRAKR